MAVWQSRAVSSNPPREERRLAAAPPVGREHAAEAEPHGPVGLVGGAAAHGNRSLIQKVVAPPRAADYARAQVLRGRRPAEALSHHAADAARGVRADAANVEVRGHARERRPEAPGEQHRTILEDEVMRGEPSLDARGDRSGPELEPVAIDAAVREPCGGLADLVDGGRAVTANPEDLVERRDRTAGRRHQERAASLVGGETVPRRRSGEVAPGRDLVILRGAERVDHGGRPISPRTRLRLAAVIA